MSDKVGETSDLVASLRDAAQAAWLGAALEPSAAAAIERAAERLGGDDRWHGVSNPELEFLGHALEYWLHRYSPTNTKQGLVDSVRSELRRRGLRAVSRDRDAYPWRGLDGEDLRRVKNWACVYGESMDEADRELLASLQQELDYWREERGR